MDSLTQAEGTLEEAQTAEAATWWQSMAPADASFSTTLDNAVNTDVNSQMTAETGYEQSLDTATASLLDNDASDFSFYQQLVASAGVTDAVADATADSTWETGVSQAALTWVRQTDAATEQQAASTASALQTLFDQEATALQTYLTAVTGSGITDAENSAAAVQTQQKADAAAQQQWGKNVAGANDQLAKTMSTAQANQQTQLANAAALQQKQQATGPVQMAAAMTKPVQTNAKATATANQTLTIQKVVDQQQRPVNTATQKQTQDQQQSANYFSNVQPAAPVSTLARVLNFVIGVVVGLALGVLTLGAGLLAVGAVAWAVSALTGWAFLTSMLVVGLPVLVYQAGISMAQRYYAVGSNGQTQNGLQIVFGSVLDVIGVTKVVRGAFNVDLVSGSNYDSTNGSYQNLSDYERGKQLGGGIVDLGAMFFGGRIARGLNKAYGGLTSKTSTVHTQVSELSGSSGTGTAGELPSSPRTSGGEPVGTPAPPAAEPAPGPATSRGTPAAATEPPSGTKVEASAGEPTGAPSNGPAVPEPGPSGGKPNPVVAAAEEGKPSSCFVAGTEVGVAPREATDVVFAGPLAAGELAAGLAEPDAEETGRGRLRLAGLLCLLAGLTGGEVIRQARRRRRGWGDEEEQKSREEAGLPDETGADSMNGESAVGTSSDESGSQAEAAVTVVSSVTATARSSAKSRGGRRVWGSDRLVWMAAWLLVGSGLLVGSWCASSQQPRLLLDTAEALPASGAQVAEVTKPCVTTVWQRIEEVRVGQRVLGHNPLGLGVRLGAEEPGEEPDPKTWRQVRLRLVKSSGRLLQAVLLRRVSWLEANQVRVGGTIQLNMPEMGAVGEARVAALEPCPAIVSGPGQVVTATFCHEPDDNILNVWVGNQQKPIGVTDTHPWWSEDRKAFVAVGKMQVGEQVWTRGLGVVPISKIAKRAREAWVYNLEVQGEHVYEVSALGVLVHNNNSRLAELSKDPQTGFENPKSISEANTILQAEAGGLVRPGSSRRPNLQAGEPNLDFNVELPTGENTYVDIKTPQSHQHRPLLQQATDIAAKSKKYDPSVRILIDLKNIAPADRAAFVDALFNGGLKTESVLGILGW